MALHNRTGCQTIDAGDSRMTISLDGCIKKEANINVTTTGTSEQVLKSVQLSRGLITQFNAGLDLWLYANTRANGNNKQLVVRYGYNSTTGEIIFDSGLLASNSEGWILNLKVDAVSTQGSLAYATLIRSGGTSTTVLKAPTSTKMSTLAGISINAVTPDLLGDITLKSYRLGFSSPGGVF